MKVKKVNKKLSLNKKTIANLADSEQMLILGGATFTVTCPETNILTCETYCNTCTWTGVNYNTCTSCDFSCPDIGTCDICITGGTGGDPDPVSEKYAICH